ncbi:DUF6152 family protein [Phenylobacterium aquaticum]|uniref:DUF6152 family protein n=1 Tax=Phenylobacterium aquaticum TaxID=1763816 RepID=UPI001F5D2FE0|nr:DUF6152 family protein [Phenylobacterium aquaticum]MCI3135151.1 DUF6152 family protein [Phenylobacterium aquaticum]
MKLWQTGGAVALAALSLTLAATPASAHHSAAMFDHAKIVTLSGTVKEFKWMNPHGWIQIMAPGPAGPATEWSIECSSINILARKGWSSKSFKPGDKISLSMHPMKDGSAAGFVLKVDTADGHSLTDHDY